MAEEEPRRKRRRSSGRSSQESLVNQGRSRSGSHSTLSSPGSSPRRLHSSRKPGSPPAARGATLSTSSYRRVSAEALEQGISAVKSQYKHRRVSVAYVQGSDHSAAVLTLSRTTSPVLERARVQQQARRSSSMRTPPASSKARRHTSVIEHTKSSMLQQGSPKSGPSTRASPQGRPAAGHNKGSRSSPSLGGGDSRRDHHHHHHHHHHHRSSGSRSHPTSKTALLSTHSTHWDKAKAAEEGEFEDDDTEEDLVAPSSRSRNRTGRRGLEMAVAGCIMLLGTGALMVAFMWGGDSAWTIVGSTCMTLGALFLVLGVCWYLSKTRDGAQEERLEIRVVDAKQMARLIKQGLRVKPVDAV